MVKGNAVRAVDVWILGPAMMILGWQTRKTHPILGPAIAISGAATIIYNGLNYLLSERAVQALRTDGRICVQYDGQPYTISRGPCSVKANTRRT